jgi:hypothetical protein
MAASFVASCKPLGDREDFWFQVENGAPTKRRHTIAS